MTIVVHLCCSAQTAERDAANALTQMQADTAQRILRLLPGSLGDAITSDAAPANLLDLALQGLERYLHKAHRYPPFKP